MAVAVAHAAAEERHCRTQERLPCQVLGLREPGEKVAELLDGKGVVAGELLYVAGIAPVVAELVARLGDANLRDGEGVPLSAQAEGGHAGKVRLKGEHHKIIDGAEIVARLSLGNVTVGAFAIGAGNIRKRRIEPRIGPPGADLRLTHRGEVLVEAAFVFRADLFFQLAHFSEVVIEHAGLAAQSLSTGLDAALRFLEHGREDFAATTQRRQLHAICGPGEGTLREGNLHRGVAGVLRGDFRHLLVHGNGVAIRGAELPAGQEDVDAIVMVTQGSGVVQSADGRDDIAVLLQRLERAGELVILPRLGDLIVQRVDAVGEVDEGAATG